MNIFTQVKKAVSTREAASFYGIEVKRGNMCCCPFHSDKHPSMSLNDEYYHCFGCGASGDVINFVASLYELSQYEAAKKIIRDFNLPIKKASSKFKSNKHTPSTRDLQKAFEVILNDALKILNDYHCLLHNWKTNLAPTDPENGWDNVSPLYEEGVKEIEYIGYLIDELSFSTRDKQLCLIKEMGKEIHGIEERIKRFYATGN